MGQQIRLEVVTPSGAKVNEDVDIVNAPGYGGDFGVLANHAPLSVDNQNWHSDL
jgi:F-type H+-transporting ATPase subunit epsilon